MILGKDGKESRASEEPEAERKMFEFLDSVVRRLMREDCCDDT